QLPFTHPVPPSFPTRRSSDLFASSPIRCRNPLNDWLPVYASPPTRFASRITSVQYRHDWCGTIANPTAIVASSPSTALRNARHRSEEHTSELQSRSDLVCRLL